MNIEELIAQLRSARYAHEVSLEMLRAAADALEAMRAEANTCGSGAGCCAQAAEIERLREILARALAQMRTQRRIDRAEFPSEVEDEIRIELGERV